MGQAKLKSARTEAEAAIAEFLAAPSGRLALDVCWVAQAYRECPPHLVNDDGSFLCGTQYVNEMNTDGRLIEIALVGSTVRNVSVHSVNFIFSDRADFILCKKCLRWLRGKLKPLDEK